MMWIFSVYVVLDIFMLFYCDGVDNLYVLGGDYWGWLCFNIYVDVLSFWFQRFLDVGFVFE